MDWKRVVSARGGYPFAIAAVFATTAVLVPFRGLLPTPTIMMLYVPVIVGVARLSGVRTSALAAVLSFLVLDLIFITPYYLLTVESVSEWLGLIVFFVVALVAGQQTGQLRQRERAAIRRQSELELLNRLSSRVASENSSASTAQFITSQLADVLGADRVALYVPSTQTALTGRCLASAGDLAFSSGEEALVSWVLRTGQGIGLAPSSQTSEPLDGLPDTVGLSDAIPGVTARGLYLPLKASESLEGVLFAGFEAPERLTVTDVRPLAAAANLAASSLERQRLAEEASHTEALRETDRLKTTLVSSVSHELKTPLAAAIARVTGLVEEGGTCSADRVVTELEAVAEDLSRLDASIGDLLDLSRLETDSWRPHFEETDIRDVLGTVLSRLPAEQRPRVRFDLPDVLSPVRADFAQLARALANLIENALAYSPSAATVTVGATDVARGVEIWVEDAGSGIPDEEKARVFEKFYRGPASVMAPAGTGLGLAITREIVGIHDGTIHVEDVEPHGSRFIVGLPLATEEGP